MSISTEISRIKGNIVDAYAAAEAKGATMPTDKTSENLHATIASIPVGGSSGPNYTIVGGTTQPTSPEEVTVWVNTGTDITSHVISANEPYYPVEGMVWIKSSDSSPAEFSVLTGVEVTVYPISAKQYIGGVWVPKEVLFYIGGEWVSPFDGRLYTNGYVWADMTEQLTPASATIEYLGDRIEMFTVKGSASEVYVAFGPVPMDGVKSITMAGKFADQISGTHYARVFVGKDLGMSYEDTTIIATKTVSTNSTSAFEQELLIQGLTGLYYVYAGTTAGDWNNAREFNLTGLWATVT